MPSPLLNGVQLMQRGSDGSRKAFGLRERDEGRERERERSEKREEGIQRKRREEWRGSHRPGPPKDRADQLATVPRGS